MSRDDPADLGTTTRPITLADIEAAFGPMAIVYDGPDCGPGPGWYGRAAQTGKILQAR